MSKKMRALLSLRYNHVFKSEIFSINNNIIIIGFRFCSDFLVITVVTK